MNLPIEMMALVQNESGFAAGSDGPALDKLEPYLTAGKISVPRPGKGEVLIKMRLASVNPSDVAFIKGNYGQPRRKGMPAGFEGMGEVVATGGGFMARRLRGKRVAFVATNGGAWSEYVLAAATTCIPLRASVRDEDGATMIVNPMAAHAMFDLVRRDGAKAFVMTAGASQLCKLAAKLAKDEGFRAISIVRRDEQIEPLKKMGAAHVLNSEAATFAEDLRAVLKDEKPRIFLDAVTGPVAATIFNEMGSGSRWIVYGRLDVRDTRILEPGHLIFQGKQVEGFWMTGWLRENSLFRVLAKMRAVQGRFASGAWKTDVADIIPLREAHARLPAALAGANAGKVFLTP